ncbi:MAG: glycosyltransferase family 2 protein [Muribaculaceae bacterium]|nr:glycosyltransferase family 2 protein [Muribaculaceae bacterium]
MNKPFSIVIPVYNRASIIISTLQSIKSQGYRPLHLILVDNNSADATLSVLNEWAAANQEEEFKITVTQQLTPGAAAARNKGLQLVDTEYMLFFDSDDLLLPHAVEAYMRVFEGKGHPDIVMSRSRVFNTATGKRNLMTERKGDPLLAHIHHCTLHTQGYAARTDLFRRVGGWLETTGIWDDWELGIRLLLATDKITRIPDVTCEIVIGHDSLTGLRYSDRMEHYEAPLRAAEKDLKAMPGIAALMDYRRMMLAARFSREGASASARKLHRKVMADAGAKRYPLSYRLKLRTAYHYIRLGGRGFDRLIKPPKLKR